VSFSNVIVVLHQASSLIGKSAASALTLGSLGDCLSGSLRAAQTSGLRNLVESSKAIDAET
jgi:hypothetical protein